MGDELVETGFFCKQNGFEPEKIGEFVLGPGEVREVLVQTMPQPGSFYPINFVLQSELSRYVNL